MQPEAEGHSHSAAFKVQPGLVGRAARALLLLLGISAAAMALVVGLVIAQGQYADPRHVDAIVLLDASCAPSGEAAACDREPLLDYAMDLYRRGYAARLLLAHGEGAAAGRDYLLARGLPQQALLLADQGASIWQQQSRAAELARQQGLASVLLVGDRSQMLLALKMTRDLGLAAYAAPLPIRPQVDAATLRDGLHEAAAYWRYVLLGQ